MNSLMSMALMAACLANLGGAALAADESGASRPLGFEAIAMPNAAEFKKREEVIKAERDATRKKLLQSLNYLIGMQRTKPTDEELPIQISGYRALYHDNEMRYHNRMAAHIQQLVDKLEAGLRQFETQLSAERAAEVLSRLMRSLEAFRAILRSEESGLEGITDPAERRDAVQQVVLIRAQIAELEAKLDRQRRTITGRDQVVEGTKSKIGRAEMTRQNHRESAEAQRAIRDEEAMDAQVKNALRQMGGSSMK